MDWKIFLNIFSIGTFLSGLFFLLFPKLLKRLANLLNKWFSLRKFLKPLDMMRYVDDKVYKMRKVLGSLLLLVGLILFIIQIKLDHQLFKYIITILVILNFLMALSLLLFHEILKKWNIFLNKWFSLRKFMKSLEVIRDIENKAYKMHRILGTLGLMTSFILFYWCIKLKTY